MKKQGRHDRMDERRGEERHMRHEHHEHMRRRDDKHLESQMVSTTRRRGIERVLQRPGDMECGQQGMMHNREDSGGAKKMKREKMGTA